MKIINETIDHPAYLEVLQGDFQDTFRNVIRIASNEWFNSQDYLNHDDVDEIDSGGYVLTFRLREFAQEYPSLKCRIRVVC